MSTAYSGVREEHPNRFIVGGGNSIKIAQDFKDTCFKTAQRSFSQGLQCQQMNSLTALMSMEDSVFISHSPLGCTGCAEGAIAGYRIGQAHRGESLIKSARLIVSNLDQNDIVLGGEKKLREAIDLAIERYHPKLIFVYTSCASGIIGDDVDAVVDDIQENVSARLVPVHCEGFKSKIAASGFDAVFLSISKYLIGDEKKETKKGLINLFAPVSVNYKDQLEIERMLGAIGVTANYIPFYSSFDKIKDITAAEASTSICKVFADEFMKELKEKFEIPYSHTVMPIGVHNTDKWYRGIAKIFDKELEVEEIIQKEHERVFPLIAKIRLKLEGKRAFVNGGTGRSFAAAALINDFGMKLVGLETPTYDDDAQEDINYLNELNGDFILHIANMQPYEQVNIVKRLKPDVCIGIAEWISRLGIPTTDLLGYNKPTMGYDGIIYLGNKICDQIENPSFNKKLAKYDKLPYKDTWYDEDPFKYIVMKEG